MSSTRLLQFWTLISILSSMACVMRESSHSATLATDAPITPRPPVIGGCYEIENAFLNSVTLSSPSGEDVEVMLMATGSGVAVKLIEVDLEVGKPPRALLLVKESNGYQDRSFGKKGWMAFDHQFITRQGRSEESKRASEFTAWNRFFEKQVNSERCQPNKYITCNQDCGSPFLPAYKACFASKKKLKCGRYITDHKATVCSSNCAKDFPAKDDPYTLCIDSKIDLYRETLGSSSPCQQLKNYFCEIDCSGLKKNLGYCRNWQKAQKCPESPANTES